MVGFNQSFESASTLTSITSIRFVVGTERVDKYDFVGLTVVY